MHTVSRLGALILVGSLIITSGRIQAATPDRYWLDNTDVIVTLNVRQLFDAPLVGKDLDKGRQALKGVDQVQEELDALGFDPFTDLDSVSIVAAGAQGSDQVLFIAHGRFDFAKFIARSQKLLKEHSDMLEVVKEERCQFFAFNSPGQGQTIYLGWPDSQTIIASPVADLIVHAFDVQSGKAKPSLNPQIAGLLDSVDETNVIWMVALGSALKDVPHLQQVRHVTGGLAIDASLRLAAAITLNDAKAAESFARALNEQIARTKNMVALMSHRQRELVPLVPLFDAVSVTTEDDAVNVRAEITADKLEPETNGRPVAKTQPAPPNRQLDRPFLRRLRRVP
jgi:hypothetical protein